MGCFGLGLTAIVLEASPGLAQSGEQVTPVFEHVIPNIEGKSLVALVVNYAPGGTSPAHHHAPSAHRISENASDREPASLLAVFVVDSKDRPITTADQKQGSR